MSQKFNFTGMVKENPYLSAYFDESGGGKGASSTTQQTTENKTEHNTSKKTTMAEKYDQEFEKIVNSQNSKKDGGPEDASRERYDNKNSSDKFGAKQEENENYGAQSSNGTNDFLNKEESEKKESDTVENHDDYHNQEYANSYEGMDESGFEPKTFSKRRSSKIFYKVLATMILSVALISGGFLIYQGNRQARIGGQVLGTIDTKTTDVITGGNFALFMNQKRPKEFALESESGNIELMDNKPGNTSSYLYKRNGMQSGLVVSSVEYDSKMDINSFAESVKNKLGGDYQVTSKDISLPNGVKLAKINSSTQKNQAYYVTVTTSYYYIITVYNQIGDANTTSFVDKMVEGLYLNSK